MSPSSLTSPRPVPWLDQIADLALWEAELAADPVVVESALMRRLATVPDQRSSCGLRHPLVVVLTLTACATLVVGGDSVAAIWQWATRISQRALQRLGAYRDPFTGLFTVPSERTFRRVLAELDADALDTAISGYVADVVRHQAPVPQISDTPGPAEREQRRAAARQLTHPAPPGLRPAATLDGKALRGARTAEGGRVFLVGAISHEHGVILGQCQVADKKGEGPAARALLSRLPMEGMVLTLDALHTTKTTARLITAMGGHYVLIVKGNQPLTRAAAHALLSGPDAEWTATTAIDDDHGHGRTERRIIRTGPADDGLFPGARQAFRLRRDVGELDRPPDGPLDQQRDRVRYHQPACRPGRSRPPQPLRAPALVCGKSAALGQGRDVQRGTFPGQDGYRAQSSGRLPESGDQYRPPGRPREHRPRPPRPSQPRCRPRCLQHLIAGWNGTEQFNAGALSAEGRFLAAGVPVRHAKPTWPRLERVWLSAGAQPGPRRHPSACGTFAHRRPSGLMRDSPSTLRTRECLRVGSGSWTRATNLGNSAGISFLKIVNRERCLRPAMIGLPRSRDRRETDAPFG
ncbi:ISAs1 family transposase [Nonomuraea rhizosphaerae]|uniref:ISAs1 family transposase n=1 Tax=Nonomuraea rhizosphaerae TaxID=2665663 RepID=UPI001C5DF829|nr:ISAs1 family transposase [Nonomuraea rhizosphaerae]